MSCIISLRTTVRYTCDDNQVSYLFRIIIVFKHIVQYYILLQTKMLDIVMLNTCVVIAIDATSSENGGHQQPEHAVGT